MTDREYLGPRDICGAQRTDPVDGTPYVCVLYVRHGGKCEFMPYEEADVVPDEC